jgi:hypothetical protein
VPPNLHTVALACILTYPGVSLGQVCQYGLGNYSSSADTCKALQKEALQRVASAKTICHSANSQVLWNKNNKEPAGAFMTMDAAAHIAMKGFKPLYVCDRADLVVKTVYDATLESVAFVVTDAESGDIVFHEERSVSDLGSDLTRMATHFQNMRSDALAADAAATAQAEAKAKEEAFFAALPKHWRQARKCDATSTSPCPEGSAVEVTIVGEFLYESGTSTSKLNGGGSLKRETSCTVKRGADEVTPWTGDCTYKFFWNGELTPTCTVKTAETITAISAKEIAGRSQRIDYGPLRQASPTCPVPSSETIDFSLSPDKDDSVSK